MTYIDQFVVSSVTLNRTNKQASVIVVPARVHLPTSQNKSEKRGSIGHKQEFAGQNRKAFRDKRHVQIDDD